jgi:hypothetical protein
MTDDIVTRLRDKQGLFRVAVGVNQNFILNTIYNEAADEIEHLREWKELCYEIRNSRWLFMRKKHLKKFDRMHNLDYDRKSL